jgi:hypothetical protein
MKNYPIIVNKKVVLIDDNQRTRLDNLKKDVIRCCAAEQTNDLRGFGCTRKSGHKGPHVAHGLVRVLAVWTSPITQDEWDALIVEKCDALDNKEAE